MTSVNISVTFLTIDFKLILLVTFYDDKVLNLDPMLGITGTSRDCNQKA